MAPPRSVAALSWWSATGSRCRPDLDVASLAAAQAAVGYLGARVDWNWDLADLVPGSRTRRLLTEAAEVANAAVLENLDLTEISPASCTLAMGLVSGRQLLASTLGDSRVYWLPDDGAAVLLSTDDSVAQEQIDAGMDREAAETGIHGHVITKWLGRDAPQIDPERERHLGGGVGLAAGLFRWAVELRFRPGVDGPTGRPFREKCFQHRYQPFWLIFLGRVIGEWNIQEP